jgi:hypothetical protein
MAFTIYNNKPSYTNFDDSHTLEVKDSGVIEVTKEGEQVALFSPCYWTKVEPGEKKVARPGRIR